MVWRYRHLLRARPQSWRRHAEYKPASALIEADRVDHLDAPAREPMVVEHPDGTLFVSGYGEPRATLWQSRDAAKTWTRVNVGSEAEGALGNRTSISQWLAMGREGTLYFVTMT